MVISRRGLGPALALAFVFAACCKGDKETDTQKAPPPVAGAVSHDPEALRRAVDQAEEHKIDEAEAGRIGATDRGDAARVRTLEARLGRIDERLDAMERKASLTPPPDKPSRELVDSLHDKPNRELVDRPEDPEPELIGAGKPLPQQPDVIEPPPEDVADEPAATDGEQELGFLPAPLPEDDEDSEPTLILSRAAVAPSINRETREPVDPGTVFDASVGKLYAFMVFKNPTEEQHQVTVVWMKDGEELSRLADLKVGPKASRWRTWAYVTINERRRGDWAVKVLGPADELLGTVRFRVD